jgi:hypothetical protein
MLYVGLKVSYEFSFCVLSWFLKYYTAEPKSTKNSSNFIKSCFEHLLTFLKYCVPKFSKNNTGCIA